MKFLTYLLNGKNRISLITSLFHIFCTPLSNWPTDLTQSCFLDSDLQLEAKKKKKIMSRRYLHAICINGQSCNYCIIILRRWKRVHWVISFFKTGRFPNKRFYRISSTMKIRKGKSFPLFFFQQSIFVFSCNMNNTSNSKYACLFVTVEVLTGMIYLTDKKGKENFPEVIAINKLFSKY